MAKRLSAFAPVADAKTRILIVGSMPSEASLLLGQYYGNPKNAFWRLIYAAFGQKYDESYEARLAFLLKRGLGLWDAAQSCEREGSLDAKIRNVEYADFEGLFLRYPGIGQLLCNGGTAFRLYQAAAQGLEERPCAQLPSSSPAAAKWRLEEKLAVWAPYLRGECFLKRAEKLE
jgi:TDG/mug DNA glycosylase family protein